MSKKKSTGFTPSKSLEEKRAINKQTYILEAIVLGLGVLYFTMCEAAYESVHPRADFSEALTGVMGEIPKNPLYFWPVDYSIANPLGITSLVLLFVFLQYNYTKFRVRGEEDAGGKTLWGSAKEISHRYAEMIIKKGILPFKFLEKEDPVAAYNNTMLSKNLWASMNAEKHFHALNTLIVGVSGSGKTRFWLKPNLLQMNCSYAITDPKGEILDSCGEFLRRNGYDVKVFDVTFKPGMPIHCNTYNPLEYCEQESDIRKIVNSFVKNTAPPGDNGGGSKDPFWEDSMMMLLCSIIGLLCSKPEGEDRSYAEIPEVTGGVCYKACFPNVCEMVRMSGKKWTPQCGIKIAEGVQLPDQKAAPAAASELGVMFENLRAYEAKKRGYDAPAELREKPYCLREWENIFGTPDKTFETIKTTTTSRLDPFNIEQIKNLTATDNINLHDFPKKRTALFLIMSATDRTYNFLLSFMYTQLFDVLYRFGETDMDGSKYITLQNSELVRWFSRKEIEENKSCVDDYLKKVKKATIEKVVMSTPENAKAYTGKDKKGNTFTFEDAYYDIKDEDGNLITRRVTKEMADRYVSDLQKAKIVRGIVPKLPTHYRFLIDEFPNIGEIPEFKEKLATMRGYNISTTVICQSITQLKGMYEKDYEVIDANCPFFVFLGGDENTNNEYIAKKIGKTTTKGGDPTVGAKKDVSTGYKTENVELMRAEDIGRISFNQSLVFIYGEMPIIDEKYDLIDHKYYKLTKEYLQKCGIEEAMNFDRLGPDFVIENAGMLTWTAEDVAKAIPNVVITDSKGMLEALRKWCGAATPEDAINRADANIKRHSFEEDSTAVAY